MAQQVNVQTTCDRWALATKRDLCTGMQAAPWRISAPTIHTTCSTNVNKLHKEINGWMWKCTG